LAWLEVKITSLEFWHGDFTSNKHQSVDDKSYGGGPGMVMMVAPLKAAIDAAKVELGVDTPVIYLSPQGRLLKNEISQSQNLKPSVT
jgi:tRNA (guanine37-N1)-methyltransferase